MNSENNFEVLQSLLQYYRSKCSQLEYEFLVYKIKAESTIKELESLAPKEQKRKD
jgi:hypothetical protein